MSYPINYPTPQGANIQIFQQGGTTSDWVKPQGASFVWFTLIGGGGGGGAGDGSANGSGGGSGAVTNFMCPAFLIPDVLRVSVGAGGRPISNTGPPGVVTSLIYQEKNGTGYTLLTANPGLGGSRGGAGSGGAGGTAMTANYFTAIGFFQSVAGEAGSTGSTPSPTTFLSGGSSNALSTANYGYSMVGSKGFGVFQPIIVSVGGGETLLGQERSFTAGFGSGGGGGRLDAGEGGSGGDGLAVIITW